MLLPLLFLHQQWRWVGGGWAGSACASSLSRAPSSSCRAPASSRWLVVVWAGVVEEGSARGSIWLFACEGQLFYTGTCLIQHSCSVTVVHTLVVWLRRWGVTARRSGSVLPAAEGWQAGRCCCRTC
jgi:hypothetical protein